MGKPATLKCRICGGEDYRPLVHLVFAPYAVHEVDMVNSPKAQCIKCRNMVDTSDPASIKAYVDCG